jgi:hypothetical protein
MIPRPPGRSSALGIVLAAAGVAALFLWFHALANRPTTLLTREYTAALTSGQTYLRIAPNPQLLAAANPFDPDVNRSLRVLDASLFHGRYFLFFGITPFITFLMPWALAFGRQLSDGWAITAYSIGALLCAAAVLRDAGARYFPRAGRFAQALALAGAAVCSGGLLLIRNPSIHELEVAAAWFFDCATLLAAYRALHGAGRPWIALALAGLCAGLAVGARPSHLFFAALILIFIVTTVRNASGPGASWIPRCAACLGPLSLVALGVAWFNWHRFGNPVEFGYGYALVDVPNFASSFAGARNVPYNLWHYLIGLPRLSGWFPFFEFPAGGPIPVPKGYYALEQVYGALVTAPFVLCLFSLFRGWSHRPARLRSFIVLLLSAGALNLAFLSVMNAAVYRYTADFLPYFAMSGAMGFLAMADGRRASWLGAMGALLASLLVVLSAASSVCIAFALYDLARSENPSAFAWTARIFDEPRLLWEGWLRKPLTEFRIEAALPADRFGAVNPLLVSGQPSRQNFIYLYYTGPGRLQVGFEATGRGGPVSKPVPVDYGKPVVFELALGCQWPPAGAWPYHGLPAEAVRALRRRMLLRVNGITALDTWVDYHPDKGLLFWGRSPDDSAFGAAFAGGRIEGSEVPLPDEGSPASENPGDFGPVQLRLSRAASSPARTRQPLVCVGYRNRWQSLSMEVVNDDRVRLFVTTWGGRDRELSADVSLPVGTAHNLELAAGSLLPPRGSHLWGHVPEGEQDARRRIVRVSLDGRTVLEGSAEGAPEVGPMSVTIGENSLGENNLSQEFQGQARLLGRSAFGAAGGSR